MLVILVCFALFVLLLYISCYVKHHIHPLRAVPGPACLDFPVTGDMGFRARYRGRILDVVQERLRLYGSISRSSGYYGRMRLRIADPEWAKFVLTTNASRFVRGRYIGAEALVLLAGPDNILMASGDVHRKLRKVGNAGFRPSALQSCIGEIEGKAGLLVEKWDEKILNGESDFEIKTDLTCYTLDCLGQVGMGMDLNCLSSRNDIADILLKILGNADLKGYVIPFAMEVFAAIHSLLIKDVYLDWIPIGQKELTPGHTQRLIRSIREQLCSDEGKGNLLRSIRSNCSDGTISENEMIDLFITFILAGTETSSTAIGWTLWLLADHQDIQRSVSEECRRFFDGQSRGSSFDFEKINDEDTLHFTKLVLRESMRLYPPVPFLIRMNTEDVEIAGYMVPKWTDVLIGIFEMHRNPAVWGPDVDEFDPLRPYPKGAFMPFGDGNHKCIGYQLANIEMVVALAYLMSRFRFERLPGDQTAPRSVVSLQADPPIRLNVSKL